MGAPADASAPEAPNVWAHAPCAGITQIRFRRSVAGM